MQRNRLVGIFSLNCKRKEKYAVEYHCSICIIHYSEVNNENRKMESTSTKTHTYTKANTHTQHGLSYCNII